MAHGAAPPLVQPALDGKPRIVKIQKGKFAPQLLLIRQFRICTGQYHRIGAAYKRVTLWIRVKQIEDRALADHRIVIKILFQAFPELQRQFVKGFIARQHVI